MSSTNRSKARSLHVADYYVTPISVIETFLQEQSIIDFTNLTILDPCAGGDPSHCMSYPSALRNYTKDITSIDIREDSLAKYKQNYLLTDIPKVFDVIITNPPFNLAMEIIEKALQDVVDAGYVVMLLRLNFFGSKRRKPFFDKFPPLATYVHSKRISFTEEGTTDSIEYMHCIWQKGLNTTYTKLRVI